MKWTKMAWIVGCLACLPSAAAAQGMPGAPYGYPAYPGVSNGYPAYPRPGYGYPTYPQAAYRHPVYPAPSYGYQTGPVLPPRPFCLQPGAPVGIPPGDGQPEGPTPFCPAPPVAMPASIPGSPPGDEGHGEDGKPDCRVPPQMIGDSVGSFGTGTLFIRSVLSDASIANYATTTDRAELRVPLLSRGAYKIGENESPRPMDRVFLNLNYFSDVPVGIGPRQSTLTLSPELAAISIFGPGPFPLRETLVSTVRAPTAAPGSPPTLTPLATLTDVHVHTLNVYRETFGFEKTIGDNLSVGLRVPLIQTGHPVDASVNPERALAFESPLVQNTGVVQAVEDGLEGSQVGDLTVVLKYVLAEDVMTGDVFSTGVVVTAPTGQDFLPADGSSAFNPVLLQPWFGGVRNSDKWYYQGFLSVVVPSDFRDSIILFNDFGVGCRLYQASCADACLTGVTPTAEVHVSTPITHRGLDQSIISAPVLADVTGGVHLDFGHARLTTGASIPVTGPRVFDVQVVAQLNWIF